MLSRAPKRGLSSLATLPRQTDIHPGVAEALHERKPAISLESTIITHGIPHSVSLGTTKPVKRNVRASESAPATIGLAGGRIKIGLEPREFERPAERKNKPPRRDTGAAFAFKRDGGTTRSATFVFATHAGIKVRPNTIFSVTRFNLSCRS